jgi:UDP-N-acetylglucosamine 1-carboxyvinyltransferase
MGKYIIDGGKKLDGKIIIQSAKNAVLPLLAASILTDEQVIIHRCPKISDVINMKEILSELGCKIQFEGDTLIIDSVHATCHEIPKSLASELRSSIFMLGSIISRFGKAKVAYPGGCDIGLRPIDLHIKGLKRLGVHIREENGIIDCKCEIIKGAEIVLDCPSVGATENIVLAAAKSKGRTIIRNAAKEPEIVDLQNFINKMGGKIYGAGTATIVVDGVEKLTGVEYTPIPDRIEAGTFLIAAAITGGNIEIANCNREHIASLIHKLRETACKIDYKNDKINIKVTEKLFAFNIIETMPYPGFPTDLQAQMLSLACVLNGTSMIVENMFETRYKHVSELLKMGADITVRGRTAVIRGVNNLSCSEVSARDLRGGAALTLAALNAKGKSIICETEHIDRGYFNFYEKLKQLGAEIKKI